jgi:hypothetical protein
MAGTVAAAAVVTGTATGALSALLDDFESLEQLATPRIRIDMIPTPHRGFPDVHVLGVVMLPM